MAAVDYLLQETSVGYGLYQVVMQADAIGNRLKEVQEAAQNLGLFGKMVKLVSFAPFQFVVPFSPHLPWYYIIFVRLIASQ